MPRAAFAVEDFVALAAPADPGARNASVESRARPPEQNPQPRTTTRTRGTPQVKTAGFWTKDWFLGLAVAIVLAAFAGSDLIQSLERKAYDLGVRATDRTPSDRIAIVAIDDASIQNIGRWPWPRDVHAKVTDLLSAGKAKVVGTLVFFTEPQLDPGLAYVNRLAAEYQKAVPDPNAVEQGSPLATIGQLLAEAESALNTDRKLAAAYEKSGTVLLPMLFELGDPRGKPDRPLPDYVTRNALGAIEATSAELPFP